MAVHVVGALAIACAAAAISATAPKRSPLTLAVDLVCHGLRQNLRRAVRSILFALIPFFAAVALFLGAYRGCIRDDTSAVQAPVPCDPIW